MSGYIRRPEDLKITWGDLIHESGMSRQEWADEFGVPDESLKQRVGRGGMLTARELQHLDELTNGLILGPPGTIERAWVEQALARNVAAQTRRTRATR